MTQLLMSILLYLYNCSREIGGISRILCGSILK